MTTVTSPPATSTEKSDTKPSTSSGTPQQSSGKPQKQEISLDPVVSTQDEGERYLILGAPGTGKTTSALTFPEPRVVDYDNKCPAGHLRYPFFDSDFCRRIFAVYNPTYQFDPRYPNRKDALDLWMKNTLHKLPRTVTLIFDSLTAIDAAFHDQCDADPTPFYDSKMQLQKRWIFGHKIEYFRRILGMIRGATQTTVLLAHEQIERDEKGEPTGKIRTLMTGQTGDVIGKDFTGVFRMIIKNNPADKRRPFYCWRVVSDECFTAIRPSWMKTDLLLSPEIPATYESLLKLKRGEKVGITQ